VAISHVESGSYKGRLMRLKNFIRFLLSEFWFEFFLA